MRLLAFDTCFSACSAAVIDTVGARTLRAAACEVPAGGQAERLVPMIGEVMRAGGVAFSDLDAIAVTTGPGTFTGVRTGVAAARGLGLATGLPVRGLSSLALIARTALADAALSDASLAGAGMLAVAMDARQGKLFLQAFGIGHGGAAQPEPITALAAPQLVTPEAAAQALPQASHIVAVGSGAPLLTAALQAAGRSARPELVSIQPVAAHVELADLDLLSPPLPLYLRPHDARPQPDTSLPRAPP